MAWAGVRTFLRRTASIVSPGRTGAACDVGSIDCVAEVDVARFRSPRLGDFGISGLLVCSHAFGHGFDRDGSLESSPRESSLLCRDRGIRLARRMYLDLSP